MRDGHRGGILPLMNIRVSTLAALALSAGAAGIVAAGPDRADAQGAGSPAAQSANCPVRVVGVRFTGDYFAVDRVPARALPLTSVSRGRWGVSAPCTLRARRPVARTPLRARTARSVAVLRCRLGGRAQVRYFRLRGGAVRVQVLRNGTARAIVDARVGKNPWVRYNTRLCARRT